MAKNKREKIRRAPFGWLRISLELIVVFVGVTGGFLFDSYREDRSDRNLEKKYLISLHQNLLLDSALIKRHIAEDQNNLDISKMAAYTMAQRELPMDSALKVLAVIATFNNLNMQKATYESIVNSGSLGLISDWTLREELVNYYSYQQSIRDVEMVYNDYINSYVMPFLFKTVDLINGELAADFRTDSKEFKNLTAGYYSLAEQKMEVLLEIDSSNHALLSTLALALARSRNNSPE